MTLPIRLSAAGAVVLLSGVLGACAPATAPGVPEAPPAAEAGLNQSRAEGPSRWELTRWQQADGTLKPIPHGDNGEPVTFEFSAGIDAARGLVSGYSGCNRFRGSYGKVAAGIVFGPVAGTRMACEPSRMALESALYQAMQSPFSTVGVQPSAGPAGRQVIWKTAAGDLLQFVEREGLGGRAEQPAAPAGAVEKTIEVDAQRVACTGVAPQQCYRVRQAPDAPWTLWYGAIEGFDFEPGTRYRLRVRETRVANPPADASSIRWELIRVESSSRGQ